VVPGRGEVPGLKSRNTKRRGNWAEGQLLPYPKKATARFFGRASLRMTGRVAAIGVPALPVVARVVPWAQVKGGGVSSPLEVPPA